ncbi:hypothetical protein [Vallitalea guaymasensis]|uniref:hypothetical protein n=1 Tax=Vallitalea guaymasensis TaxID=1185412 RepID=UPI000DE426A4|nr:hypothetical protein [Vallitalea guaymasensis]
MIKTCSEINKKEQQIRVDDEKDRDFFKGFDKVLIVGNCGSGAYPLFRWQIFNTNNEEKYLWIDIIENKSLVNDLKKDNIDILYNESLENKAILKKYKRLFLNIAEDQSIDLGEAMRLNMPFTLRIPAREIRQRPLKSLKEYFDLIIIAKPIDRELTELHYLLPELEKEINLFKRYEDVIFVDKKYVKLMKVTLSKDFPLNV